MAKNKAKKSKSARPAKRKAAKSHAKKAKPVRSARAGRRASKPPPPRTILHHGPRIPPIKAVAPASEKPLSVSEINKFRDILTHRRDDLVAIVARKKEQEFEVEEPGIGDEADIATRSVEKDILFELTDSEKQTLEMVEAALRKIEKGFYGHCESCQRNIGRMRLEVMPWARYCIECQARQEIPAESV